MAASASRASSAALPFAVHRRVGARPRAAQYRATERDVAAQHAKGERSPSGRNWRGERNAVANRAKQARVLHAGDEKSAPGDGGGGRRRGLRGAFDPRPGETTRNPSGTDGG